MTRYKAVIAYDGTDFSGFQSQTEGVRTVQEELEKVLEKINSHQHVTVYGAGRTDSGVHALGQVIHFDLPEIHSEEKLRFALDTQSPVDIAVLTVSEKSEKFHSRFSPHEKTYCYRLDNAKVRDPFKRRGEAWFRYPLEESAMQEGLEMLIGTHDFSGFTASGSSVEDKIRTIRKAQLIKVDQTYIFNFTGNGFLYKQVRNMVGTLIKIGNGKFAPEQVEKILSEKNRQLAGPTAHPEGLYLKSIHYQGEE